MTDARKGTALALASALLFGASVPAAKRLVEDIPPLLLSGLLYLGAGLGLSVVMAFRNPRDEAPLAREDLPTLVAAIACGGVVAPFLLLLGLSRASGFAGSLALGLEMPLTAILAAMFFGETLGRRDIAAIAILALGGALLSVTGKPGDASIGLVAIVFAGGFWALDNNLTRRLSGKDPVSIARVKGLSAGTVSLVLGLAAHGTLPPAPRIAVALVIGFAGYGLSLTGFIAAMRRLGAARTGALFSVAPFLGALVSIPILGSAPNGAAWIGGAVMAIGVTVLVRTRHEHEHRHDPLVHEHRHTHDEHHRHEHGPEDPPGEPHSHVHRHDPIRHAHPHVPDLHHRHGHGH